jgi:predicted kinase
MKLLMLRGLPASGKSTYARTLADKGWVRVNKDDLRAMLHNGKWSREHEKQVLAIRDHIIEQSLSAGLSVVVDDTNLAPKHRQTLTELAKKHAATFETKTFDVPIEECIKRDLARANSVGERVIRQMYDQFLDPPPDAYHPPEDKPSAVLCDIDGTLAHMRNRSPYEWSKVGEDSLDDAVKGLLDLCNFGYQIILLSGRDSVCRPQTEEWLRSYGVPYDQLFMRAENDNRKDSIVKRELFDDFIRNNYQVQFVLDDRDQVVKMWRAMGLKCLQVAEGDF